MPDSGKRLGSNESATAPDQRRDFERGLQFTDVVLTVLQSQGSEAVAYSEALLDLLVSKGIIGEE
jgi:hypothetical protein